MDEHSTTSEILKSLNPTVWCVTGTIALEAYLSGCPIKILSEWSPWQVLQDTSYSDITELSHHLSDFLVLFETCLDPETLEKKDSELKQLAPISLAVTRCMSYMLK